MSFALTVASRVVVLLAATWSATAQEANQRTGTVSGRVLGPLGEPMPNVGVTARRTSRSPEVLAKTRTDAEGMFVMARVPNDSGCTILASAPGLTTGIAFASLGPDEPDAGVQLRLWEADTLRGRVLDADGKPVAGASVLGAKYFYTADHVSPEGKTDAEGRFELPGVPIGACVIRAWAPGFAMCELPLNTAADVNVDVTLARGGGVSLAITTEGLPAEVRKETKVRIYPTYQGTSYSFPEALERYQLDSEGSLSISGLPDVQWRVALAAPGFRFEPRGVRVEPGPRVHQLPFRASRQTELVLRGILRSGEGTPLARQTLLCRCAQRAESGQATTDGNGRFEWRGPLVAGDPYFLQLAGSGLVLRQEKAERDSDLGARTRWEEKVDPERELALVAVPAAFVTGRLVDGDGRPVPFVWTELQGERSNVMPPWGAVAHATSLRDGTFRMPGVPALDLDLRVHAEGEGGAGASPPFRLSAGQRRTIEVTMQSPGVVEGRVVDASGKPMAGVSLSLGKVDERTRAILHSFDIVASDRQGRFVFTGVAPGGHRIDVDRHETAGKGTSDVFDVPAGATVTTELLLEK